MTIVQDRGWRVGDQGIMIAEDYFQTGSLVELVRDDGDVAPLFRLLSGSIAPGNIKSVDSTTYVAIDHVAKIYNHNKQSDQDDKQQQINHLTERLLKAENTLARIRSVQPSDRAGQIADQLADLYFREQNE